MKHARVGPERARDLDELLLGHAQRARLRFGIDARPDAREQLRGARRAAARQSIAAPGASVLQAEGDVLRDA